MQDLEDFNKSTLYPIRSRSKTNYIRVVIVDPGEEPKIMYIKELDEFNLRYRTILSNLIYLWDNEWDALTQLEERVVLSNVQCTTWKYDAPQSHLNCIVDAYCSTKRLIANRILQYDSNTPKLYLAGRAVLFKGITLTSGVVKLKDFDNKELKSLNKLLGGKALDKKNICYLSQEESNFIKEGDRYNGEYEKELYAIDYNTSFIARTENLGEYYGN